MNATDATATDAMQTDEATGAGTDTRTGTATDDGTKVEGKDAATKGGTKVEGTNRATDPGLDGAAHNSMSNPPGRIERWAGGGAARTRMPFFWGFAEASFFIIIPDVIIGFAALWNLRNGMRAALWAVAGAVVGGTMVFLWPAAWQAFFPKLYGISPAMMDVAAQRFADGGWWAMVVAPAGGLPYKLFAAEAALEGRNVVAFWFFTVVARSWRFVAVALIAGLIGRWGARMLRGRPAVWTNVYIAFWIAVYIQYYVTVAGRYGL